MDILIYELHTLSRFNIKPVKYLTHYTNKNKFLESVIKRKITKISGLLDELLIDNRGHIDWDNYDILRIKKYEPFPLEQDSFGWLVGGVQTSKGIIIFG